MNRLRLPAAYLRHLCVIGVLLAIVGIASWYAYGRGTDAAEYPEVATLSQVSWTYPQYSFYFKELAEEKGAVYAYEVMKRSTFPSGVSLHLIAHTVGGVLYAQEGAEGMKRCTQDFRNACSHAIVTGVLAERGPGALADIVATCEEAPGAGAALGMCFHGLGHGVLAYNEYDYRKAVLMCAQVGPAKLSSVPYTECIGGATMEMVSGVHDRALWEKEAAVYFTAADPLYPCDASFMPEAARPMCLSYFTPQLLRAAGMSLDRFDAAYFPKALSFCAALALGSRDRDACYAGFGKEFPAASSDVYVIDLGTLKRENLEKVRDWCAAAEAADGVTSCNRGALSSLVWGAENAADGGITFCTLLDGPYRTSCYRSLATYYRSFSPGKENPSCARLPQEYRAACAPVHATAR